MFVIKLIDVLWSKFRSRKYYRMTMEELNKYGLQVACLARIINKIEEYAALGIKYSRWYILGFTDAYLDYIDDTKPKIAFENPVETPKIFRELIRDCEPFLTDSGQKLACILVSIYNGKGAEIFDD